MRVLIVGAGAIGSVLGGFLAKGGHDVTLLGRAWHLDEVKRHGLRISGIWGEHRLTNLATATRLEDIRQRPPFDWAFVCVKAHATAATAEQLGPWLDPKTRICAFQNGLGNYEALRAVFPAERVALARVITGMELSPGQVNITVSADDVLIGAPDPACPRDAVVSLCSALQASGISTRATSEIFTELWIKVLYNCALNGMCTVLEVPYGRLMESPQTVRVMTGVIEEAYRIAAAHKIPLRPSTAEGYRELFFTRLVPDSAAHYPSMLQDVRRGKPTEIDAMNGALVRLAEQAKVPAPMNALVTRLVKAKERWGAR